MGGFVLSPLYLRCTFALAILPIAKQEQRQSEGMAKAVWRKFGSGTMTAGLG